MRTIFGRVFWCRHLWTSFRRNERKRLKRFEQRVNNGRKRINKNFERRANLGLVFGMSFGMSFGCWQRSGFWYFSCVIRLARNICARSSVGCWWTARPISYGSLEAPPIRQRRRNLPRPAATDRVGVAAPGVNDESDSTTLTTVVVRGDPRGIEAQAGC